VTAPKAKDLTELVAGIVSAHLAGNRVAAGEIGPLIREVHAALKEVAEDHPVRQTRPTLSVDGSVDPENITCLVCGRKRSMLRRHLRSAHGLSEMQYREKFSLPESYPMVAPNYSDKRRNMLDSLRSARAARQKR
jgi:predicted transcriptional regulator